MNAPAVASQYVVFDDRPDLGHTPDPRHPGQTRCEKPLTAGTWRPEPRPFYACTACLPRPEHPVQIDDDEDGLW